MRIHDYGEAEGIILQELRKMFPTIPIFVALDMHASMSDLMMKHANGFVGYKTAPHIDCTETGVKAAELMIQALKHNQKMYPSTIRIPIIVAGEKSATDSAVMVKLMNELDKIEKSEGIVSASLLMGFPWSDNKDNCMSVHVISTLSKEHAQEKAQAFSQLVYNHRHDFVFVSEAYETKQALEYPKKGIKPVYISDSGDNPTAGASADNTTFLELLLDNCHIDILEKPLLYAGFYDPEAVESCIGHEGKYIPLQFGAKFDSVGSKPIDNIVYLYKIIDNYVYNGNPSGSIELVSIINVYIILTQQHIGFTETRMFADLGLNPLDHPIIVSKLGNLTPSHKEIAKRSIFALTSGHTNQKIESINYQHIRRPRFH